MRPAPLRSKFVLDGDLDLRLTLGALRHGRGDPTIRLTGREVWLARRSPAGPATLHLRVVTRSSSATVIDAEAWGPGAEAVLAGAPALVGADDDPSSFSPQHPLIDRLRRERPGLRIPRSADVMGALLPTILGQKVTRVEAKRAYHGIVRRWGEPAPGPPGLRLAPTSEVLAGLGYHELHRLGVERRRAETIRRVAATAGWLAACADLPLAEARARLGSVPGVGPWTVGEVAIVALGDADAVSLGDYHLPHLVTYALAGERRGDDRRMLALLAPWTGHRGRVIRLLESSHLGPPRRGPRLPLNGLAHR